MLEFNQGYKKLITYPRMIEVLLRGFVAIKWLEKLDFSHLDRINPSFVSLEYQHIEGGMI